MQKYSFEIVQTTEGVIVHGEWWRRRQRWLNAMTRNDDDIKDDGIEDNNDDRENDFIWNFINNKHA